MANIYVLCYNCDYTFKADGVEELYDYWQGECPICGTLLSDEDFEE